MILLRPPPGPRLRRALAGLLCVLAMTTGERGLAQPAPSEAADEPPAEAEDRGESETEARARFLFQEGRNAFYEGRFEEALALFRRAHALSRRDTLLYNIGQSLDRLRRDEEAIEAFELYLERVPSAPNRGEVEARLQVLRRAVSRRDAASEAQGESSSSTAQNALLAASPAPPESSSTESEEGGGSWWVWTLVGVGTTLLVLGGLVVAADRADTPPQVPGADQQVLF